MNGFSDGVVNLHDFSMMSSHWGAHATDPNSNYDAYFENPNNLNGIIDVSDFYDFSNKWLTDPNGV